MKAIHRSIGFSAIDRYGKTLFQIVSIAILARLLTPAEFGIYTTIYAFTALGTVSYREFGGANYLIQKSVLTEESIRTAFTVSLAISFAVALLLFALRDIVAAFFAEESLKIGIAVAALNFLLTPFAGTMSALLRRKMQFDVLALCNLTSSFIAAGMSVLLAALGYSFMSLIFGTLLGQAIHARQCRLHEPHTDPPERLRLPRARSMIDERQACPLGLFAGEELGQGPAGEVRRGDAVADVAVRARHT